MEGRLNAYYDFIHDYFPILPPRVSPPLPDEPIDNPAPYAAFPPKSPAMLYVPQSPLSLAVSAILALIPHPEDPEPLSEKSVIQRRAYAHTFATLASLKAEADWDFESSCDLSQPLPTQELSIPRGRFHDHTPVELESLLALLVLSVYEYAQRGNLLKMKSRAGQALSLLWANPSIVGWLKMEIRKPGEEPVLLLCPMLNCQLNEQPLTININDPEFKTPYPKFSSDKEGWSILIQTQQLLVSATQYITDLDRALSSRTNLNPVFQEMQRLDAWARFILARVDQLPTLAREPDRSDYSEIITAKSIRAMSRIKLSSARIKIHRFRAFSNIPIFIKKHCDLAVAYTDESNSHTDGNAVVAQAETENPSCPCSNLKPFQDASAVESSFQPSNSNADSSATQGPFSLNFPYSCQYSTKICYQAAIVISKMFESLPIPHPLQKPYQQQLNRRILPRTMPSFACCLMQSSYAMLMLFYKARVGVGFWSGPDGKSTESSLAEHISELRYGLRRTITAASNYSQAFEALNGMRDEIRGAYETAFPEDFTGGDATAISADSNRTGQTQPLTQAELDERSKGFPRFWTEPNVPGQRLRLSKALTALEVAAGLGNDNFFGLVRDAGADESAWLNTSEASRADFDDTKPSFISTSSPVHEAIEAGQPAMLHKLLHVYRYSPNYRPLATPTAALPPLSFALLPTPVFRNTS
ncbi:hypothetical protein N7467_001192 [Penicillium canescens]|nr:hypothetical protein N7467_001192 [Penicillium canescens]